MMKQKGLSIGRIAFALAAVLSVAGSGMVFAAGPGPDYPRPTRAVLLGPGTVSPNSINGYTLEVYFVTGPPATFAGPPATFSATAGTWNESNANYTAPSSSTPRVLLTGKFTSSDATVTVNRAIVVQ